ncbi:AzlC family ABC transporter permease [Alloyangia pacifica]|uniref:AzlC family ABC transporter permease n=1 Tax=Alloyangia pacifica TaxID=311180 RepID=UPI001CD46B6B|nr:AzlC family ABC transporter permease [Alloyangia pacifica]MCA0996184.1 AzlC family ABC transporter permease [Alloyangia pacifica]
MARSDTGSYYWQGLRAGLPFLLVIGPFATLFGVLANEAGLNLFDTLSFSVVVIAGAAQFVSLQMLQDHVPALIVLASALAVNLRMAMYSAAITPHLGALSLWKRAICAYFLVDQTYASSALQFERSPEMTLPQKFAFFMGTMTPICPPWYIFTLVGAWVGEAIPADFGLDFALPIAFLAMIAPALRTGAHVVAALVATLGTLLLAWMPYNLGVLCAAALGMMAGAETERRMQR